MPVILIIIVLGCLGGGFLYMTTQKRENSPSFPSAPFLKVEKGVRERKPIRKRKEPLSKTRPYLREAPLSQGTPTLPIPMEPPRQPIDLPQRLRVPRPSRRQETEGEPLLWSSPLRERYRPKIDLEKKEISQAKDLTAREGISSQSSIISPVKVDAFTQVSSFLLDLPQFSRQKKEQETEEENKQPSFSLDWLPTIKSLIISEEEKEREKPSSLTVESPLTIKSIILEEEREKFSSLHLDLLTTIKSVIIEEEEKEPKPTVQSLIMNKEEDDSPFISSSFLRIFPVSPRPIEPELQIIFPKSRIQEEQKAPSLPLIPQRKSSCQEKDPSLIMEENEKSGLMNLSRPLLKSEIEDLSFGSLERSIHFKPALEKVAEEDFPVILPNLSQKSSHSLNLSNLSDFEGIDK